MTQLLTVGCSRPRHAHPPPSSSSQADFSAWAAEKAELAAEARASAEQAAAEERAKRDVQSRAAEAAFTRWTIDKAVHDRALAVFPQLAPSRGAGDDEWREVTLALAYTQVYLDERFKELSGDYTTKISNERSLDRAFLTWTRKAHGYDKVSFAGTWSSPLPILLSATLTPRAGDNQ